MSSEVSNKSNGRKTTQNKFFTDDSGEKVTVNHLLEMKKKGKRSNRNCLVTTLMP